MKYYKYVKNRNSSRGVTHVGRNANITYCHEEIDGEYLCEVERQPGDKMCVNCMKEANVRVSNVATYVSVNAKLKRGAYQGVPLTEVPLMYLTRYVEAVESGEIPPILTYNTNQLRTFIAKKMKKLLILLMFFAPISLPAQFIDTVYTIVILPADTSEATIQANLAHFPSNFAEELMGQIPCGVTISPFMEGSNGPFFIAMYCYQIPVTTFNQGDIETMEVDSTCITFNPQLGVIVPCDEELQQEMEDIITGPSFDVPTMSQWRITLLALLLLIFAIRTIVTQTKNTNEPIRETSSDVY